MSSNVPWKELTLVGVATLGVCCLIGWATGAENLQQKKKKGGRGGPAGNAEAQEIEALMQMAEATMKKGLYSETEKAYLRVLDIAANSDNPEFQMVPTFMARRLADLYEKMGNWDKCFKFNDILLEVITKKTDPTPEELASQLLIVEHVVELAMSHATPDMKEKFLLIWQEMAMKAQHAEHMVFSSLLLGKLKIEQEKYTEAEAYLRRAGSVYTENSQREELWLSVKTAHLDCLTKLENHEAAKKCIMQIADFLLNFDTSGSGPSKMGNLTHEMLSSYGDRCVFLGYLEEAEHILKSTQALMKRRGLPPSELAPVDHSLAIVYSATGRLPLAREKIQEMKEYLRTGMSTGAIFPSYSKYLHTQAVKHEEEGTTIVLYRVNAPTQTLKPGNILVVKFENPDVEGEVAEVEHVVQEKEPQFKITGPYNYSNYIGQIFSAEITIYSDAEKSQVLGTHFVFIPSTSTPTPTLSSTMSLAQEAILERLMASGIRPDQLQKEDMRALEELLLSMGNPPEGDDEMGGQGFVGEGQVWQEDDDDDIDEDDEDDEDDEEDDEERLVLNK